MWGDMAFLNLGNIFSELELVAPSGSDYGLSQRRISSNSRCDLFVAVQKPINVRVLLARFHISALPDSFDLPHFRSLELVESREMDGVEERLTIMLRAPQSAFNDVFTSLAEDIARHVGVLTDENEAAIAFHRRLMQWQRLLQRQVSNGLSLEEQRGLYGELWFLRETVLPMLPALDAIIAWTGPEAAAKDFQFNRGIAAEVKTTLSRQPQTLTIANERQLDDIGTVALYLVHLSVEAVHGTGENLPEMVQSIRDCLSGDITAMFAFEERLLDAGYLDAHARRYQETGYIRRGTYIYHVVEGFPRIIERELPNGVGDLRYTISVSACQPFVTDFTELTDRIGG